MFLKKIFHFLAEDISKKGLIFLLIFWFQNYSQLFLQCYFNEKHIILIQNVIRFQYNKNMFMLLYFQKLAVQTFTPIRSHHQS